MAKETVARRNRGPVATLIMLLLLEMGIVFLALPKDTLINARTAEAQSVASYLGQPTETQIKNMADNWFRVSFLSTGFMQATYNFLLNQWEGKEGDLQLDDRGLSVLVDRRLDVFWLAMHYVYYRAATILVWIPYMLPVLFAAGIDGLLQREIRKWQFSFSSPAAHQAASKILFATGAVLVLIPFLPLALPPLAMPVLMGGASIAMWVHMANIQKRI